MKLNIYLTDQLLNRTTKKMYQIITKEINFSFIFCNFVNIYMYLMRILPGNLFLKCQAVRYFGLILGPTVKRNSLLRFCFHRRSNFSSCLEYAKKLLIFTVICLNFIPVSTSDMYSFFPAEGNL